MKQFALWFLHNDDKDEKYEKEKMPSTKPSCVFSKKLRDFEFIKSKDILVN